MNKVFFYQAINQALHYCMKKDKRVICFGLGATDPKHIFGTTNFLEEKFGSNRVFDTPTSENGMTGIGIGASLNGSIPVMIHQRLDFFLLAMDQLVNNAAKWHYMFGSKQSVPITIRLIMGRGWGQGPTHSQNLHSWFAHIPGLKVVMPSCPEDAKGLLISSVFDPNPVLFLENRWLYNTYTNKNNILNNTHIKIGKAKLLKKGKDITLLTMSYLVNEAIKASHYLQSKNIDCEIIDLRSIKPIDWSMIKKSVKKTGRLLALDTGHLTCSVSSDIISKMTTNYFDYFNSSPKILAMPDVPEPTSHALTKNFYTSASDIVKKILLMFNIDEKNIPNNLKEPSPHDIPGKWFEGPF